MGSNIWLHNHEKKMRLLRVCILALALVASAGALIGPAAALAVAPPEPTAIAPQTEASDPADNAAAKRDETLVIGRVTAYPAQQFSRLQVFNDHLASHLERQGIRSGNVVMTRNLAAMAERLRAGEVDYLVESVYGALVLESLGLVEISLAVRRNGLETYRSLFVAHRDSPLSLDKLAGAHILFEDPGSTTGFFLPYVLLRGRGYHLVPTGDERADQPNSLTYSFAGTETAVAASIVRGNGDIGTISDRDWRSPNKVPASVSADLKIIGESDPGLRAVLLLRADMPRARRTALVKSLTALSATPSGAAILDLSDMGAFLPLTRSDRQQLSRFRALHKRYAEELP